MKTTTLSWLVLGTGVVALIVAIGQVVLAQTTTIPSSQTNNGMPGISRSAVWQSRLSALEGYEAGNAAHYEYDLEGSNPTGNNS